MVAHAMRVRVCNRAMRLLSAWQNPRQPRPLADGRPTNWSQSGELPLNAQRLPDVDLLPELITPVVGFWRWVRCRTLLAVARIGASDYLCSFSRDGGDG